MELAWESGYWGWEYFLVATAGGNLCVQRLWRGGASGFLNAVNECSSKAVLRDVLGPWPVLIPFSLCVRAGLGFTSVLNCVLSVSRYGSNFGLFGKRF